MLELYQVQQRQSLPLEAKIAMSKQRIKDWYDAWNGKVYVSFSGGKDSTVLLHLVRSLYPDVQAVFLDTGIEYPEIREFVNATENCVKLHPKHSFMDVIKQHGYPVVSKEVSYKVREILITKSDFMRNKRLYGDANGNGKLPKKWHFLLNAPFKISHYCCHVMKKNPAKKYEKETGNKPMVGTMAVDSRLRWQQYMKNGCNQFSNHRNMSTPIAFWTEDDVWEYIKRFNVPYSKIYDMGYSRTGCCFCMFGLHMETGENRFQRMKHTHPYLYNYCLNTLGIKQCLDYLGVKYD